MKWKSARHSEDGGQCLEYREASRWDTPFGSERSYFNATLNFSVDVIGFAGRTPTKAAPEGLTEDERETWPHADNLHAATCRELLRRIAAERINIKDAEGDVAAMRDMLLGSDIDGARALAERTRHKRFLRSRAEEAEEKQGHERSATVLFLRSLGDRWCLDAHAKSVLMDAANAIERGEQWDEVRL